VSAYADAEGRISEHVRVYAMMMMMIAKQVLARLAKPAGRVRYSVDAFDTHMELAPNGKCQLETK
jgi:histone H3/H4